MFTIYNLPVSYEHYIVAREVDGELWFWGSWDRITDAHNAACAVNGQIYPRAVVIRG